MILQFLGWLDRSTNGSASFLKVCTSNGSIIIIIIIFFKVSTKNGSITLSSSHVIFRSSISS